MNTDFHLEINIPSGPAIIVAMKDGATAARNRVAVDLFAALLDLHLTADGFNAGPVRGHGYWNAAAFFAPVHSHCVNAARELVQKIVARHMTGKAWVVAWNRDGGISVPENFTLEELAEHASTLGEAVAASVEMQSQINGKIEKIEKTLDELSREVRQGNEWKRPDDDEEGADK